MFRTIIRHVRKWKKMDDDVLKLKALDDYLLADMGIDRERIGAVVRGKRAR
jgi:uncharacterized protein YjiS (DUF1127 family)